MEWTKEQLSALCTNNGLTFYNATQHYGLPEPRWGSPYQRLFEIGYTTADVTDESGNPAYQTISGNVVRLEVGEKPKPYRLFVKLYDTLIGEDVESNTFEAWDAALKRVLASPAFARCKKFKGESGVRDTFLEQLGKALKAEFDTVKRKGNKLSVEGCVVDLDGLFGLRVGRTDVKFDLLTADFDQTVKGVLDLVRKRVVEEEPKPTDFRKVKFCDYDLDTGGEREYAQLTLRWDTSLGELSYCKGYTAHEIYSETWSLDGEKLLKNRELWSALAGLVWDDLSARDLDPPTYESGGRAEETWRDEFDGVNLQVLLSELKEESKEGAS